MLNNPFELSVKSDVEIEATDDLLMIELDDRLEFSTAMIDGNLACNGSGCTQNGSCQKPK